MRSTSTPVRPHRLDFVAGCLTDTSPLPTQAGHCCPSSEPVPLHQTHVARPGGSEEEVWVTMDLSPLRLITTVIWARIGWYAPLITWKRLGVNVKQGGYVT